MLPVIDKPRDPVRRGGGGRGLPDDMLLVTGRSKRSIEDH
jgi:hypothetical protein